jgi:hypothetical protein
MMRIGNDTSYSGAGGLLGPVESKPERGDSGLLAFDTTPPALNGVMKKNPGTASEMNKSAEMSAPRHLATCGQIARVDENRKETEPRPDEDDQLVCDEEPEIETKMNLSSMRCAQSIKRPHHGWAAEPETKNTGHEKEGKHS